MSIRTRHERDAYGNELSPECRDWSRIPACIRRLFPSCSALLLLFSGLTFVWSLRVRVTEQRSCKSQSHSNYLQSLLEGHRLCFHARRDRPANPLMSRSPSSFRFFGCVSSARARPRTCVGAISRLKRARRPTAGGGCVHGLFTTTN